MGNVLKPTTSLLCKLASIAVHVDEATSQDGHEFDIVALKSLLMDAEVMEWLKQMDEMALIPKKRK